MSQLTTDTAKELHDLHMLQGLLQTLDVGLVVLNKQYAVTHWNSFMENRTGLIANKVLNRSLFECFPNLSTPWLKRKIETVFQLNNRVFITWEQKPYLFRCKPYRPITSGAAFMYQNVTLIPLSSLNGEIEHLGLVIYDVTDIAVSRLAMEKAHQQLKELSQTDHLTGLANRGYWEQRLQHEFERFGRAHSTSTLVMLDIDHFKKINDTYGHLAGDEVLRQLASVLRSVSRSTDLVGRYGGEEFGILLIDCKAAQAQSLVSRLQSEVNRLVVEYDGHQIQFTLSLGMAEISPLFQTHQQWISLSDQALYHSKESGRNRLTVLKPES